ncbi:MAG: reverse transcriptase N-terminal domain-containing protein [Solirubrobacteraceae bacterium]
MFTASKARDLARVRNLQKLMLRSRANTLISVRRVTERNAGSLTAGVDGEVVLTPEARPRLVERIEHSAEPFRALPVRRVYIPKPASRDRRPLGIPVILDRCHQARVAGALEPEWEARFEPKSAVQAGRIAASGPPQNRASGFRRTRLKQAPGLAGVQMLRVCAASGDVSSEAAVWVRRGSSDVPSARGAVLMIAVPAPASHRSHSWGLGAGRRLAGASLRRAGSDRAGPLGVPGWSCPPGGAGDTACRSATWITGCTPALLGHSSASTSHCRELGRQPQRSHGLAVGGAGVAARVRRVRNNPAWAWLRSRVASAETGSRVIHRSDSQRVV